MLGEAAAAGSIKNGTILSQSFRARGTRERAAAAGAAGAGVRGGRGDADRVREPFESAAGARSDAAEGNCDSRGAGRGEGGG